MSYYILFYFIPVRQNCNNSNAVDSPSLPLLLRRHNDQICVMRFPTVPVVVGLVAESRKNRMVKISENPIDLPALKECLTLLIT